MTTFTPDQQIETLAKVLKSGYIKDFNLAIDGGANHGDWAILMTSVFQRVMAFEPAVDTYESLVDNTKGLDSIICFNNAIMDKACPVNVISPPKKKSDRSRYVKIGDESSQVMALSIDSLNLPSCGLIKLDVEGAEYLAIAGAVRTIIKYKPVLIVELNGLSYKRFGYSDEQIVELIKSMSYEMVMDCPPDKVFAHKEALK